MSFPFGVVSLLESWWKKSEGIPNGDQCLEGLPNIRNGCFIVGLVVFKFWTGPWKKSYLHQELIKI